MVRRLRAGIGFGLLLGGTFLLAYKQVSPVFLDPRRTELGGVVGETIGDPTWVILSAFLLTAGLLTTVSAISRAQGPSRLVALPALGLSTVTLLILHLTLYINSVVIGTEQNLVAVFTASYLFHTGEGYRLIAVFLLFLVTMALLCVFVASLGHLLAPKRFWNALWNPRDWSKIEAGVVASSLLLVWSLTVFVVYLVRVAVQLELDPPPAGGFFTQNLLLFYYLQIGALGLLILTVAARVFLVNWGTQTPLEPGTIRDSLDNVGRLERVLVGAALVLNLFVLAGPAATGPDELSVDPVFYLNSRGLAWAFFLLAVPYLPYAVSLHRLRFMLEERRAMPTTPFSTTSLRLVVTHLSGLVLLTAIGVGARWTPLGLMSTLCAWTAGVFLFASVRFRLERGLPRPLLRGSAAPPLFFAFTVVSLATGFMLWGAGNTYVATYRESGQTLTIENASPYGADIFFRLAGASLLSFTVLFAMAVARSAMGSRRTLVVPYASSFLSLVVLGMIVFSVNVWNEGTVGLSDAYAGFGFHAFGPEELVLVAVLVLAAAGVLYWSLARIVGQLLRPRPALTMVQAKSLR